jgi:hypothetical protein
MDMSHEATKDAAFTISSRHEGCRLRVSYRIVIRLPVSVTQGANRAEVVVDSVGDFTRPFAPVGVARLIILYS